MYYNNFYPYQNTFNEGSILKKMSIKKINWSNVLNNTQKTLNVINQAIPVYYQIKPIWGNAKTMFRMVNAIKDDNVTPENSNEQKKDTSNGPVFFL